METLHVLLRVVGTDIVEKEKRIVLLRGTETDRTMQMDASTFDCGATPDNLKDTSIRWHDRLLGSRLPA